jgi:hypothetical protein
VRPPPVDLGNASCGMSQPGCHRHPDAKDPDCYRCANIGGLTFNADRHSPHTFHEGDRVRIVWGGRERVVRVMSVQEPDEENPTGPTTLTVEDAS